jgi:DNA-directed RNA polymerases I and III subunit RPAC1
VLESTALVEMAEFTHYRVLNDEVLPILDGPIPASATGNYLQNFLHNLQIKILSLDRETIVFDLIGVDTSIANALRRILLAEVPTMAIETIYIQDNTSIVQDEVLSHRLGLVPIFADPDLFEDFTAGSDPTDLNTIVFKLDVTCTNDPAKTVLNDSGLLTQTVYSGDFEWQPQGDQAEKFTGLGPSYSLSLSPHPSLLQNPSAPCTTTSLS